MPEENNNNKTWRCVSMNESWAYFATGWCLHPLGLVAASGNTTARLAHGKRVRWGKAGQTWLGSMAACLNPLKLLYRMTPSPGKYKN